MEKSFNNKNENSVELLTAEQMYKKWFGSAFSTTKKSLSVNNIINMMIEYTDQFIELAAEEAEPEIYENGNMVRINKESILKLKQLNNK